VGSSLDAANVGEQIARQQCNNIPRGF